MADTELVMESRRILITGVSNPDGGRLAQWLERQSDVEAIVGVDAEDPKHELERTEFVRVDPQHAQFGRILRAAAIDTVIDTRLVVDPLGRSLTDAHEVNVNGTSSMLAACGGADSRVRKLVVRSSAHYYGCHAGDPAFLDEEIRARPPTTAIERDMVAVEQTLEAFAAAHPATTVTVLRCADAVGAEARSSYLSLLSLPALPSLLGFDPRCQFIHQEDVVGALGHAVANDLPGAYNAAADGVLTLSEVASLLGKPALPVLPAWGTVLAAGQLRRLGLQIPVELLRQLRFGRGLDNRRLKAAGYAYRYTTREAVLTLRDQPRPLLGSGKDAYRYEREVEEFLRWSPSVRSASVAGGRNTTLPEHPHPGTYDELDAGEVIEIISSLEPGALHRLRHYEASHGAREGVLEALDRELAQSRDQRPGDE
jgi:UDP-glucose 4-epimerase